MAIDFLYHKFTVFILVHKMQKLFPCVTSVMFVEGFNVSSFQQTLRDEQLPHLLPQISDVLENINRQMLLILKTNDLMRGVEFTLKAQNR
jgi:hypothetical protein